MYFRPAKFIYVQLVHGNSFINNSLVAEFNYDFFFFFVMHVRILLYCLMFMCIIKLAIVNYFNLLMFFFFLLFI